MPRLLVSVRDASEVRAAVRGGAAILDVKDPDAGSLGRPTAATITAVADQLCQLVVDGQVRFSIALGELHEWLAVPDGPDVETVSRAMSRSRVSFAKLGLADACKESTSGDQWISDWLRIRSRWPGIANWVAVAYVDSSRAKSPPVGQVLSAAIASRCSVLLLDTWGKDGTTLTDWVSLDELQELRQATLQAGLQLALAGRIGLNHLKMLRICEPDIVAVRGSVCVNGDRRQPICEQRVRDLADRLADSTARTAMLPGNPVPA